MLTRIFFTSLLLVGIGTSTSAQTLIAPAGDAFPGAGADDLTTPDGWIAAPKDNAVYYALQKAVAFTRPDSGHPYVEVMPREPVEMLRSSKEWAEIVTRAGARGFVSRSALSNLWIRISKRSRTVWLHRGAEVAMTIPADMAYNFFLDKERRGSNVDADHWRTPEGLYYVVARNAQSRFYKALVLNYPSAEDARQGRADGVISEDQYYAILAADQRRETPPMNTPLGGWIEIHGEGSGWRTTWTRGCVAVTNESIDELWDLVPIGTPVVIEG